MSAVRLREWAADKGKFETLDDYTNFASEFCNFRALSGFQAELVSRNNPVYQFLQYKDDADYQITRPINSQLFYHADELGDAVALFHEALKLTSGDGAHTMQHREALRRVIYTCQQSIGAALDALPATRSNLARKVNGDLFERLIRLTIEQCGVDCQSGVVALPVGDSEGNFLFDMRYQHDVMVNVDGQIKAIGSVKTTSKDRLGKIFVDKLLYNRMSGVETLHFAIFLHDVQRVGNEPNFRTSSTFLPGHFKGYTIKLNPLDGVYYCDLPAHVDSDPLLAAHISAIDRFYVDDLPRFIASHFRENDLLEDGSTK